MVESFQFIFQFNQEGQDPILLLTYFENSTPF